MTVPNRSFLTRAFRRSGQTVDRAPSERSGDIALIVILALVFAPVVAMHLAFSFGAAPAWATPVAVEQTSGAG